MNAVALLNLFTKTFLAIITSALTNLFTQLQFALGIFFHDKKLIITLTQIENTHIEKLEGTKYQQLGKVMRKEKTFSHQTVLFR